ncbi:MAG: transposase, partial [Deltaproteobacteria bacterium]|nr:transposase [Deltaproteobacteria bacterium]
MARMGHKTNNARLSDMVLRCLELVEGVADVIFRQVMSGTHCHSDATGFPVLAPGSDATHLGQIFGFGWGK